MAQLLEHCTTNIQIVGSNPVHTIVHGIYFPRKIPYVEDVTSSESK